MVSGNVRRRCFRRRLFGRYRRDVAEDFISRAISRGIGSDFVFRDILHGQRKLARTLFGLQFVSRRDFGASVLFLLFSVFFKNVETRKVALQVLSRQCVMVYLFFELNELRY